MSTLPLDARTCACGQQFDHDDDAALSSEEIRIKAEELYESYLAARAEQAAQGVMSAQEEFARDPANSRKSERVAAAIEESDAARAALAEQSEKIRELKAALPVTRPAALALPVPTAPPKTFPRTKTASAPNRSRVPVRRVMAVADMTFAASVRSEQVVQKAATRVIAKTVTAAAINPEEIIPPAAPSRTPNKVFRHAQAAKAEKILREASKREENPVMAQENHSAPKPVLTASPEASLLNKGAPRLMNSSAGKECPNCTASVPHQAPRCRCGYEFPSSESLIPGLAMSEEERAAFLNLFRFP